MPALIKRIRAQQCPVPFEILSVNNDSDDNTLDVLAKLTREAGAPLRFGTEYRKGIVSVRNRVLAEGLGGELLVMMDDNELPRPGFLSAVVACFEAYPEAGFIGGQVEVDFAESDRPRWLSNDLLGFLAATDNGDQGFWVEDERTPLWTSNIAYRSSLFMTPPELRFDFRYDRVGKGVGGGEDMIMFRELRRLGIPTRYCPEMIVDHAMESWRLHPWYFLKLNCKSGFRQGRWELGDYQHGILGVPAFLFGQLLAQAGRTISMLAGRQPGVVLRQAMTADHALGIIAGCHARWRASQKGAGKIAEDSLLSNLLVQRSAHALQLC